MDELARLANNEWVFNKERTMKRKILTTALSGVILTALITGAAVQVAAFVSTDEMLARYERAQHLMRGTSSNHVVQNTTIRPYWVGDSNFFMYLRQLKDGFEFRLVNVLEKTNKLAFDHKALAEALGKVSGQKMDAKNLPLFNVVMSLKSGVIRFKLVGRSWVFDMEEKTLTEDKKVTNPDNWIVSPDGKQAAFLKDHNIWIRDLRSGEERDLTSGGEEHYGYGEPSREFPQIMWSPDGKRLFTVQFDAREVEALQYIDYVPADGSIRSKISSSIRKALVGDKTVRTYRLLAIDVATGKHIDADYGKIPYHTGLGNFGIDNGLFTNRLAWWGKNSRLAYFVDMDRYQKHIQIVEFDTVTGATRKLFEEKSDTYLKLTQGEEDKAVHLPLPDTDELLWYSERSGYSHLYLYDMKTGTLKNVVTKGDWLVQHMVRFDAKRREAFIQTSGRVAGRNPYYRDLVRVNIDTGKMVELASSNHDYQSYAFELAVHGDGGIIAHVIDDPSSKDKKFEMFAHILGAKGPKGGVGVPGVNGVSPTGSYAVVTKSRVNTVPVSFVVDREGNKVMDIETADVSGLPQGWQWPEPVKATAADGKTDIYGVVYRPSDFSPDKSYPVVSNVLNMLHYSYVPKGAFDTNLFTVYPSAALAELGFVVVQFDGRGTSYRGKAFRDHSYGYDEAVSDLADHVAGIKQLGRRYSYMDLDRVGIVSLWGRGAVQGMMRFPDFYKVGVNQISVDFVYWCGKFFGPEEGRPVRKYPIIADMAHNLKGKLLLTASSLEAPGATIRLTDVLQKAGKDYDMIMDPDVVDLGETSYRTRRVWDYLVRHLQGNEPPKEFKISGTAYDIEKIIQYEGGTIGQ